MVPLPSRGRRDHDPPVGDAVEGASAAVGVPEEPAGDQVGPDQHERVESTSHLVSIGGLRERTIAGREASLGTCFAVVALAALRIVGLDRLYFERVDPIPPEVRALLPDVLTKAAHEADEDVAVRDLPLPGAPRAVLRELFDTRHPRIAETWWAVYDHGRRGDVWRYSAASGLADGKALVNLRIEGVASGDGSDVMIRLAGHMSRPQGAWSIAGKVLTLRATKDGLAFAHLRNAHGFFHGYDTGGAPPSVAVASERADGDGFEGRRLDPAPDPVLARCGFREPDEDGAPLSWDALDRAAACVTDTPGHTTVRRKGDEPSFSERGGTAR